MELAVLSDIHGNIRALNAVIRDLEHRGIKQVVNLGDCLHGLFGPKQGALPSQRVPLLAGDLKLEVGNGDSTRMRTWVIYEHTLIDLDHARS